MANQNIFHTETRNLHDFYKTR